MDELRKQAWAQDSFVKRQKLLWPALLFCVAFFLFYYFVLIIPNYGLNSVVFIIDNLGGSLVVCGFIAALIAVRTYQHDIVLMLPSFSTVLASALFLTHQDFYKQMDHLWISSLVIGIVFSIFLGTPRLNAGLFFLNIIIPLALGWYHPHLNIQDIAIQQAIVIFSSIVSIFLSHSLQKEQEQLTKVQKEKDFHEQELRRANQLAKIGGWSLDVATQSSWLSEETYHIYELPVGSAVPVSEGINFYAEEARPQIIAAVEKCIGEGVSYDLELPFITAKKRKIWVRAIGECHTEADGRQVLRGTLQDISEKVKSDEKLKSALKAAEQALATKSLFLANMSHEIRTPMNGVLGNADLLLDDNLNPAQEKIVKTIIQSGESMLQILNDILDFSTIESGKVELDLKPMNLFEDMLGLYQFFAARVQEKNITLKLEVDEKIPKTLHADGRRVRQIVSSLVSNAIKFTDNGTVTMRVALVEQKAKQCCLRFEVEDTGIGIEQQCMDRLFSDFFQSDLSTTKKFAGTGLGLAISQRLSQMLGSQIEVKSIPGQGSLFYFQLVLDYEQQGEAPLQKEKPSSQEASYSHLHVLLVEDIAINRELAQNLLKRLGIDCLWAVNGVEAIDQLQKQNFDIIFMDCQMPVMDGYEATKTIRNLPLAVQPIIIAMTANALSGDKEKCLNVGMDDYIAKPISKKKIKKMLDKWQN